MRLVDRWLDLNYREVGVVLFVTYQQGAPVILTEMILPGGFDPVLPSFPVWDVTI